MSKLSKFLRKNGKTLGGIVSLIPGGQLVGAGLGMAGELAGGSGAEGQANALMGQQGQGYNQLLAYALSQAGKYGGYQDAVLNEILNFYGIEPPAGTNTVPEITNGQQVLNALNRRYGRGAAHGGKVVPPPLSGRSRDSLLTDAEYGRYAEESAAPWQSVRSAIMADAGGSSIPWSSGIASALRDTGTEQAGDLAAFRRDLMVRREQERRQGLERLFGNLSGNANVANTLALSSLGGLGGLAGFYQNQAGQAGSSLGDLASVLAQSGALDRIFGKRGSRPTSAGDNGLATNQYGTPPPPLNTGLNMGTFGAGGNLGTNPVGTYNVNNIVRRDPNRGWGSWNRP